MPAGYNSHIVIRLIDTFLDSVRVLYSCRLKKFMDNRIKANADLTEQKIKLTRAHAEAIMKRLVVMVVHVQEYKLNSHFCLIRR